MVIYLWHSYRKKFLMVIDMNLEHTVIIVVVQGLFEFALLSQILYCKMS